MRKVLIISHYFSDQRTAAAVRITGLGKFLKKFGWEPLILTSKLNPIPSLNVAIRAIEAPCEDNCTKWKRLFRLKEDQHLREGLNLTSKNYQDNIDLIMKLWRELFAYPDPIAQWRKIAVEKGNDLIIKEGFDAIISSSGPPTCHIIAGDLKKIHNIPWIADFRDLWTQNHYFQYSRFRHYFEQKLEVNTLLCADALTTVSQPLLEKLMMLHKGKECHVITNGFDPDNINYGTPLKRKFTITYTGNIYKDYQDPEPLFRALRYLINEKMINPEDIALEFFGNRPLWLIDDLKKYKMDGFIKLFGLISRESAIEKQRQSHLLLLLTWNDSREKGIYTGKIFDYLAARRPILSIGDVSGTVAEQLLKETRSGVHCSTDEDIKQVLINTYNEFKRHNDVSFHGNLSAIDQYSHREMAQKFSRILNKLVMT